MLSLIISKQAMFVLPKSDLPIHLPTPENKRPMYSHKLLIECVPGYVVIVRCI